MRQERVDERDSSWEIEEARYRVYVFMGVGNAVDTIDLFHTTIEDALEAARVLADADRHLWSLALVHDDSQQGRGLVWLSGNDYNWHPDPRWDSAAYWRARGAMQSRYLKARAQAGEPVVLPSGERSIRMFPEWSVDVPLWESFTNNYPVERGALSLPVDLENGLAEWNERWQELADLDSAHAASAEDWSAWHAHGVALLAGLREELDGITEVRPEFFLDS